MFYFWYQIKKQKFQAIIFNSFSDVAVGVTPYLMSGPLTFISIVMSLQKNSFQALFPTKFRGALVGFLEKTEGETG